MTGSMTMSDVKIDVGQPWLSQDGGLRAAVSATLSSGGTETIARSVLRIDDEPARMSWAAATVQALGLNGGGEDDPNYTPAMCAETRRVCTAAMDDDDDGAALVAVSMRGGDPDVFHWRGMDIPLRAPQVVFGDPATYKSTACMHIALSMAGDGRKVLYIDMENTPEDTERGFSRAARALGKRGEGAMTRVYRTTRRQLHLDRRGKKLKAEIDRLGVDYVFVDSATMAVPGDLNSSADVKAFWAMVDALSSRQIGCTVIAHTPKAKDNQGSPLGSRVMTSYPRKVWKAQAKGSTEEGERIVVMELIKSNDAQQQGAKTELGIRHLEDRVTISTKGTGRASQKDRDREEAALTAGAAKTCLERASKALIGKEDGLGLAELKRAMHSGSRQKMSGVDEALRVIRDGEATHVRFREGGLSRRGRYYRKDRAEVLDRLASPEGAWTAAMTEVLTPETPEMTERAWQAELRRITGCDQTVARAALERVAAGEAEPMLRIVHRDSGRTRDVVMTLDVAMATGDVDA